MKEAWFLANPARDPSQLPEHGWRLVKLPHQWSLDCEITGIQPEPDTGWYRLDFSDVDGRRWGEIFADYYCEAWVGGAYKGCHEGYFEPWVLEIPPEETLLLRVSAPKEEPGKVWPDYKRQIKGVFGQHDCRPGGNTRHGQERGSGGLWGGVRYLHTGSVAFLHLGWRAIKVRQGWTLWVDLEIDSPEIQPASPAVLELEEPPIPDKKIEELSLSLVPDNFQGLAYHKQVQLEIQPGRHTYTLVWELPEMPLWEVWERGFPNLYELMIGSSEQKIETLVGFRWIEQDGDWVKLNGKRIFLRGTNIIPTQWLAGYTDESGQRDAHMLKAANLNAVRVHAHLAHPFFYDACDREGILVWQDFPLQWGYADDESFAQEAIRQAKAMVKHYGNHVSIYQWCAHNEPTHNRHTLDPLLSAALRQADSTRLVKESSDFREHPYPGWYMGYLRDFLSLPGGHMPSEFGAQALPSSGLLRKFLGEAAWPPDWETWVYHNFQPNQTFRVAGVKMGDSLEEFVANSQEYQADLLKFAIEAYRRGKGKITGYFQFMFVEPWEGITWAVVDFNREPKKGYYALQRASNPVLLSLVPSREVMEIGEIMLSEAWVINDLDRALDLEVTFRLEGTANVDLMRTRLHACAQEAACFFTVGEFRETPTVEAEKVARLYKDLRELKPGRYQLIGEIWEGKTLLSSNEFTFYYEEPIYSTERE